MRIQDIRGEGSYVVVRQSRGDEYDEPYGILSTMPE